MSKLFLFDIDCTLLMAGGAGRTAFDLAFHELFGVKEAYGFHEPHGKTDPQIIEEIAQKSIGRTLEPEERRRVSELYVRHFREAIGSSPRFRVLEGARELVERLSAESGAYLGVQTGNFAETARLKLERAGLERFFPFGGYGCDAIDREGVVRKALERGEAWANKKFSKDSVFVIGDAAPDMRAGKSLGFRTVGVSTGRHTPDMLRAAGAEKIFDDLRDTEVILNFILLGSESG